ncbi:uncharacterized protein AKAW2_60649A [Aspergillus luchuensis]|uniref:Uncharacterized protein n=1 Tax=Aspergillus kawachii TaxID=1069201 RepID=A0A7R7WGR5_ASPKA|nr:uncharacterized protein AKAW2_60649A [Aspergillus luchuensis]BCS02385.1 hypothetical protein AKAW2_60649A [Aspergillus luchuensis]
MSVLLGHSRTLVCTHLSSISSTFFPISLHPPFPPRMWLCQVQGNKDCLVCCGESNEIWGRCFWTIALEGLEHGHWRGGLQLHGSLEPAMIRSSSDAFSCQSSAGFLPSADFVFFFSFCSLPSLSMVSSRSFLLSHV